MKVKESLAAGQAITAEPKWDSTPELGGEWSEA